MIGPLWYVIPLPVPRPRPGSRPAAPAAAPGERAARRRSLPDIDQIPQDEGRRLTPSRSHPPSHRPFGGGDLTTERGIPARFDGILHNGGKRVTQTSTEPPSQVRRRSGPSIVDSSTPSAGME